VLRKSCLSLSSKLVMFLFSPAWENPVSLYLPGLVIGNPYR
jgi:hypothetical protein